MSRDDLRYAAINRLGNRAKAYAKREIASADETGHNSDGASPHMSGVALRQHLWKSHEYDFPLPYDRDELDRIHAGDHSERGECGAHSAHEQAGISDTYDDDRSRINNTGDRSNLPPQGAWAPTAPSDVPGERYPMATLHLKPGNKKLRVRVADTPALRKVGLQNTADVDGGERYTPMLFHWPDGPEVQASLHNAGVNYPVSAYFFNSEGMFRDLQNLLPLDGTSIRARAPHRYALEIHPDDADALGLSESSQIAIEHDAKDTTKAGTINLGS